MVDVSIRKTLFPVPYACVQGSLHKRKIIIYEICLQQKEALQLQEAYTVYSGSKITPSLSCVTVRAEGRIESARGEQDGKKSV
jgi:hypothetical protein